MLKQTGLRLRFLGAGLAIVGQVFLGGVAWAHHPTITAEALCDLSTNELIINYTSTAWDISSPGAGNTEIDILFNGVAVDSGVYESPNYSFSGTLPAPLGAGPGDSVVVTALAVDKWSDNYPGGQSRSTTITIPTEPCGQPGLGRFTGGGHQIRVDGVRVTRGLTIHCDLLLSNNLEVNWNGNRFHMTEHMTTVECSDDPAIVQAPPAAPLDTLIGVGTGRYNGTPGYTIEFTLVDAGEPGINDKAALRIYETANPGNVVLNIPLQVLSGGNLQAHYDQPHK